MTYSVAGLIVSKVFPDLASTNSLLINNWVCSIGALDPKEAVYFLVKWSNF